MSKLQGRKLSISFAKTKVKTNLAHNRREYIPENVDENRQDWNVEIYQGDPREEYKSVFGEALEEYNAKQKRKDRKIKDYYSHVRKSDNVKEYEEFIIGLGSRDDWENATEDEFKAGVAVVEEMVHRFVEKNPNFHLINADVHGDESHPHAHVVAVPVGEGYKRGLSKQVSFSKALEGQGYDRQDFQGWRDDQMDAFEDVALKHGISRKRVGTNGYRDQEHYKQAVNEIDAEKKKGIGVVNLAEDMLKDRKDEFEREKKEAYAKLQRDKEAWENEKQRRLNEIADKNRENEKDYNDKMGRFEKVIEALPIPQKYKNGLYNYVASGVTGFMYSERETGKKRPAPIEMVGKVMGKKEIIKEGHMYSALKRAELERNEPEDDGPEL